ncbi:MAG: DNA alkylation repair protein [Prevotella sp.]|nr:DNA alkylation repair protein [Prevotella sp.]
MSKAKEIRQTFRLLMNGVTAQSQREKGVDYHINWGASLGHLRDLAADYGKDYDTAVELWHDDVRESKMVAVMLMPADAFDRQTAEQWIAETPTQEVAEVAVMELYQYLSYAKELAFALIATDGMMQRIYGCNIMARLLSAGKEMTVEEQALVRSEAERIVTDEAQPLSLRHIASNVLVRIEDAEGL